MQIREYLRPDGTCPFRRWLDSLATVVSARIQARIARFEAGNLGDVRPLEHEVMEARFHFGPGYRLYFARDGRTTLILLCGGDKSTQRTDILRARSYLLDYLRRGVS